MAEQKKIINRLKSLEDIEGVSVTEEGTAAVEYHGMMRRTAEDAHGKTMREMRRRLLLIQIAVCGLLIVGNCVVASSAKAQEGEQTKELRFHVSPSAPLRLLRYHTKEGEPYSEYSTILDSVEIVEASTGKVIQKLELPDGGLPDSDLDNDNFQDVNFDGYQDIVIHSGSYASGNVSDAFWIFDPQSKIFKFNSYLSGLTNVEIDKANRVVLSSNSCCAGLSRTAETYRWNNNKLELIEEITTKALNPQPTNLKAPSDCQNPTWVIEVTKRQMNGKLQKVGSKRYPMCG